MSTVRSSDGTAIAYEIVGSGPPVVLVDGAFGSRSFGPMKKLAALLAERFSVLLYDRRGRGESGDAPTYAVKREIEDLAALIDQVGEPARVYGTSSGAMLALRAVAAGLPATKLAIYEPPLFLDGTKIPDPPDFREQIASALAAGRRTDAVKLFMRIVGVPGFGIFFMRLIPGLWSKLKQTAHTLPYDFAAMGDTQTGEAMPAELVELLASITVPTLQLVGGKSPPWIHHAAEQIARSLEDAVLRELPGQGHAVAAKAIAPVLGEFFA